VKALALVLLASTAAATPMATRAPAQPVRHDGAHARVTFGMAGRAPREVVGRRDEPLTAEEDTAKQIQRLLRGPLRYGVTGLYVADAKTGEPLFSVNADDALNPASNVKMISTATALDLVGADFRYTTRLLGPEPDDAGIIHGNLYLLGTWDPTLVAQDLDELGAQLAERGIIEVDGDIVVGSDPERDGIYRAIVPIDIHAGQVGELATASAPPGFDLVTFKITAKTARTPQRPRLTYAAESALDAAGHTRVVLTIGGTIGKGGATTYQLVTKEQTADAAHAVRAALRAHMIVVNGDVAVGELGDFIGSSVAAGALPVELARHHSATLADIITRVNKWSINWLADRVIMTTAALARRETPSMDVALGAMYAWLDRHPHVAKADALVDTGSGLSYHTRITPHELVAVVRSAAGFAPDSDPTLASAWLSSLSIAGTDGTLTRRFRTPDMRGRIRGKTGTLSTAIALSGVLDIDPQRPLAFSIVTNGDRPLEKGYVRRAHEQLVSLLCKYLAKTAKAPVPPPVPEMPVAHPTLSDDFEEGEPETPLDAK
jgi:D-alanyl-D-alanine carboxypeptidase/D-alanyl-D-alanine-endopeptidase (penicillin-binding protein 4)